MVRKPNTQPILTCCEEARDDELKAKIEEEFFSVLSQVSTNAVPKLDLALDEYVREILA